MYSHGMTKCLRLAFAFTAFGSPTLLGANAAPRPLRAVSWEWTRKLWTAANAPYAKARNEIDAEIARNVPAKQIALRYKAAHDKAPGDPLTTFRWCYAVSRCDWQGPNEQSLPDQACLALENDRLPASREFMRLRFIWVTLMRSAPPLVTLGKRLVAEAPDDYDLRLAYCRCLPKKTVADCGLFKQEADKLIALRPHDAQPYQIRAGAHTLAFVCGGEKDVAELDAAIQWMEKSKQYLRTERERSEEQALIERIKRFRAEAIAKAGMAIPPKP